MDQKTFLRKKLQLNPWAKKIRTLTSTRYPSYKKFLGTCSMFSPEQEPKPWCFAVFLGIIPSYKATIRNYKDPAMKQPGFDGKCPKSFEYVINRFVLNKRINYVNNFVFTTKKILMKNHSHSCKLQYGVYFSFHIAFNSWCCCGFFRFLRRM